MNLRQYQSDAADRVIESLHSRPLLVLPTGGGKTVTACEIIRRLGADALWVAHRRELIHQAAGSLVRLGMNVRIIMASEDTSAYARTFFDAPRDGPTVHVASVQTLVRRAIPSVAVAVIDEAHHATGDSYREVARGDFPLIGLTATPFRLDGQPLGDLFAKIIVGAYPDELVASGTLHAPKVYCASVPDMAGIRIVAGEFNMGQVGTLMNDRKLVGDIVSEWRKHADGRRTVVFSTDVAHSKRIVGLFVQCGYKFEHLDGTTSKEDRDAILSRLRFGETVGVSNCMVLTEGWDLPALECAIIARPTASLNLHLQMIGRVMRACEGKDGAIVLDHAGNHHRHGPVTRRLEYSLSGRVQPAKKDPLGLRRCRDCGLMFPSGQQRCPECGWVPEGRKEIQHTDSELAEFDESGFAYKRQVWNMIRDEVLADERGTLGRCVMKYHERFGDYPAITDRGNLVDPRNASMDEKEGVYRRLMEFCNERGFKAGWVAHRYKAIFGVWPVGFVQELRVKDLQEKWMGAMR